MKKISLLLGLVSLLLLFGSCEKFADRWYFIRVENNSSYPIYYHAAYILPDTMLSVNKPDWLRRVAPGEMREFYDHEIGDPKFERMYNERLTLFILDESVVDTCDWRYIRENNMILRRYEFLIKELYADNGRNVFYPPDERMKDIKMYPPYGSK
jgi:hypothetical protein